MQTLYILQFNNYYNRQIKKYDTLTEYIDNTTVIDVITNTDFYKNDGVNTSIIIPEIYSVAPDYCVVYNNNSQSIESRWFIMETKFNSGTQYRAQLYRDLVADFYNDFINAPAFIEKATLPRNNNLIFNNENMGFNQIKTNEYLLKDFTRVPWIVGYVARDRTNPITISIPDNGIKIDYNYTSFSDYAYNHYNTSLFRGHIRDTVYQVQTRDYATGSSTRWNFCWDHTGARKNPLIYSGYLLSTGVNQYTSTDTVNYYRQNATAYRMEPTAIMLNLENAAKAASSDWSAYAIDTVAITHPATETAAFLNENGKIIQIGAQYYQIRIEKTNTDSNNKSEFQVQFNSNLGIKFQEVMNAYNYWESTSITAFYLQGRIDCYQLFYDKINIASYSVTIPTTTVHLSDAPYDMFTIPYPSVNGLFYYTTENGTKRVRPKDVLKFLQAFQVQLGSQLYDLQLLPYCPISNYINYNSSYYNYLDLTDATSLEYQEIGSSGTIVWCDKSTFEIGIDPYSDFYATYSIPEPSENSIEFKVEHECEFYRIVSPNYNGTFEIKNTSNDGLTNFTATCAYKPFTPYIKISPQFNRLYGQNFNDARGLILGGDFSLPAITDSWIEYQIQNKNYQVMFDRQIENMEFNNNLSLHQKQISGTMNAASMGVTGGIMGAQTGGIPGAVAGALVGGIASGIGAAADIDILKKQQAETLDYTKDQFGYNLGNIAARPQSLTKVSSFNPNNKIFPFLEYYTCTEEEKEALRNKIKYNGMTVMAIGTIADYQLLEPSYIKARLIRLENINADYHEALALAEEMNKGVFI